MKIERHVGDNVTLTCNSPSNDGNPDCDRYIWTKVDGNIVMLSNLSTLYFTMAVEMPIASQMCLMQLKSCY